MTTGKITENDGIWQNHRIHDTLGLVVVNNVDYSIKLKED